MCSGCPASRCPPANTCFALRDISLLSTGISMKLATNIYHVLGIAEQMDLIKNVYQLREYKAMD